MIDQSPIHQILELIGNLEPKNKGQGVALSAVAAGMSSTWWDGNNEMTLLQRDDTLITIAKEVQTLLMLCTKDGSVVEGFRTKELILNLKTLTDKL